VWQPRTGSRIGFSNQILRYFKCLSYTRQPSSTFPCIRTARKQVAKAESGYHRYGRWSLLLSWMPIIGDLLTIVAGVLREPFPVFLALVVVAKTARYLAVAALTLGWM
jgi:membrane protein YqaA with SNARE-associated domain